jgi:D-glycero-D-manno-heptose 1,7-bisphosphate phosphatase
MLLTAVRSHDIDLSRSFMVGDRASDMEAGRRAGCRTVFIDRRYAEAGPEQADATVRSLQAAAAYILFRSPSPAFGAKA